MSQVVEIATPIMPKQARSKARRQALLEYGAELLNRRDLDEISIAEITAALGFATGSFYSYFRDKEDFFVAVQHWVNDDLNGAFQNAFSNSHIAMKPLPHRLQICLDFTIEYFRKRTGVIRSALRYERRIPGGWAPNRTRTRQIIDAAAQGLGAKEREKLETVLQLAFGLLVNALLHDPGPLKLSDENLKMRILAALTPYLEDQHT